MSDLKRKKRPGPQEFKQLRAAKVLEHRGDLLIKDMIDVVAFGSGMPARVMRGVMTARGVSMHEKKPDHELSVCQFFEGNQFFWPGRCLPGEISGNPIKVVRFSRPDMSECGAIAFRRNRPTAASLRFPLLWLIVTGKACTAARKLLGQVKIKGQTMKDSYATNTNILVERLARWEEVIGRRVPDRVLLAPAQLEMFKQGQGKQPKRDLARPFSHSKVVTEHWVEAKIHLDRLQGPADIASRLLGYDHESALKVLEKVLREGCKPIAEMDEIDLRKVGLERMSWKIVFASKEQHGQLLKERAARAALSGYKYVLHQGYVYLSSDPMGPLCEEAAVDAGRFVAPPGII